MTLPCTIHETLKWLTTLAHLNAEIILVVTVCSVRYRLPLPVLPPGISVPVFVTKVAQDVKLI